MNYLVCPHNATLYTCKIINIHNHHHHYLQQQLHLQPWTQSTTIFSSFKMTMVVVVVIAQHECLSHYVLVLPAFKATLQYCRHCKRLLT